MAPGRFWTTYQVQSVIASGKKEGMIGMDETLQRLVNDEVVGWEEALEKAVDKDAFREFLAEKGIKPDAA